MGKKKKLAMWREGFHARVDAEVAHAELEKIREKNGGVLRPADIVSAARPKSSPLHEQFTWSNTVAAQKFREEQARCMVRNLTVIVTGDKSEAKYVNVTVSAEGSEERDRVYMPLRSAMSCGVTRAQVLAEAMAALAAWRRKYSMLKELAAVIRVIDDTLGNSEVG